MRYLQIRSATGIFKITTLYRLTKPIYLSQRTPSPSPTPTRPRAAKRGFDNLQQIIAAGYDPTSDLAQKLDKDWTKGGLLFLSKKENKEFKGSMGYL